MSRKKKGLASVVDRGFTVPAEQISDSLETVKKTDVNAGSTVCAYTADTIEHVRVICKSFIDGDYTIMPIVPMNDCRFLVIGYKK